MNVTEVLRILQRFIAWLRDAEPTPTTWSQDIFPFEAVVHVVERPEMYRTITAEQGHELACWALAFFDTLASKIQRFPLLRRYNCLAQIILINLADGVPGALAGLYEEFFQRYLEFGQNSIFREAKPDIRDRLIALIVSGESSVYPPGTLLASLAWIGDEIVQNQFDQWRTTPPSCATEMYYEPEWFTLSAGWELTAEGKRRDLYFQANYDILPLAYAEVAGLATPGPLAVATMQEDRCGWCNRSLMALFDLDLRDASLAFLGLAGERLRILLCLNCTFQYSIHDSCVYMDVDWFGKASWSLLNGERPAQVCVYKEGDIEYIETFPPPAFVLGAPGRTPYECAGAHLGGCPDWPQQDADYPHCPVCRQRMLFIGQHDLDKVGISGYEGYLYAFLCRACQKTTIIQQH